MTRVIAVAAFCMLAVIGSAYLHEYLHCVGASTPPTSCVVTHHYHGSMDHVLHASAYTPGDHAWIIPVQLVTATIATIIIVVAALRWPT